jgi:c-di-GMP-specific phosphodiesterase
MRDGEPAKALHHATPQADGQSLARLLRTGASAVYAASDPAEAFQWVIDLVCEYTGWPLGHVLWRDPVDPAGLAAQVWHDGDPLKHAGFIAASEAAEVLPGVGLTATVVRSQELAWVPDVRSDGDDPRWTHAAAAGLVGTIAVPIVSRGGVEGVMEYFSVELMEPSPGYLDLLTNIGIHLGTVLDRARAQHSLEDSEIRFRNLVESAPDALVVVNRDGTIVLVNEETERMSGYSRQQLIGMTVDSLVPEALRAGHVEHRSRYGAEPRRRPMGRGQNLVLLRADGTEVSVDISLSPVGGSEGSLVAASVRDLSDRYRADEAVRASERRLAEAQRLAGIGSWSWQVSGDELAWSGELNRMYGMADESGTGSLSGYLERVHPDDFSRVAWVISQAVATLQPFEAEHRILAAGGEVRWVRVHGDVVESRDGVAIRFSGYVRDTTEQRRAEDRRNRAQEDLAGQQLMLERIVRGEPLAATLAALCRQAEARYPGARCSVLLVDEAGLVLRDGAGPSLPAEFRRLIDGLPVAVGQGACGSAASLGRVVVVEDALAHPYTTAFTDAALAYGLRSVWSYPLKNAAGEVLGTFAVYRAVTHTPSEEEVQRFAAVGNIAALAIERNQAEAALARAAQVDPLTGLPNRARFFEHLRRCLCEPDARVAVMFLDLDGFKWINDSLGHPAGDRILVEVASRFERVIGAESVVARFGGDEFTVLIEDASPARIDEAAEAVRSAFTEPFVLDGGEFFLSVSVGIARNEGTTDPYRLVRDADTAMYAAKESGRASRVVFDSRMRERAVQRVTLESSIRRAIERDEFVIHFQPILDIRTGQWAGAEALVRWRHPELGLTGPGQFIPLAEETGLILPLGARILEHTTEEVANWDVGLPDLYVSTNISAIQLSDPTLATQILQALDRHEIPVRLLVVEVTESAVMHQIEKARAVLDEIVSYGIRLFIDDFGTGYSSISRLAELPVTGLKIDHSFTTRLGSDDRAEPILAAIIDLAHALDLQVVAEGIENEYALGRLRELGCDFGQGYHLGRPAPSAELGEMLLRRPL